MHRECQEWESHIFVWSHKWGKDKESENMPCIWTIHIMGRSKRTSGRKGLVLGCGYQMKTSSRHWVILTVEEDPKLRQKNNFNYHNLQQERSWHLDPGWNTYSVPYTLIETTLILITHKALCYFLLCFVLCYSILLYFTFFYFSPFSKAGCSQEPECILYFAWRAAKKFGDPVI
jgi:hypothetical protein